MRGKPTYKTHQPVSNLIQFTLIPSNHHQVREGYYSKSDLARLLRSLVKVGDLKTIQFVADMME